MMYAMYMYIHVHVHNCIHTCTHGTYPTCRAHRVLRHHTPVTASAHKRPFREINVITISSTSAELASDTHTCTLAIYMYLDIYM